jgi:DNA-binding IclR family transcriptional regulator
MSFAQAACAPQLTVERGLEVLRAFRSNRAPLTNSELVRRTGLSKATVSRLTSTMLQLGFLRHAGGSRQFELAPGPLAIGHAFVSSNELLERANPLLQELGDRLNVSVALAHADHLDMVYVGYRAGRQVGTLRLGVGSVLPMGRTAIGHAWLWSRPEPERAQLLQALVRKAGEHGPALEASLQRSFADLDAGGTCAVLGRFQRDCFAVALPVTVGRGRKVLGLSCGTASLRVDIAAEQKRIAPELKRTAARLEALLADCDDAF